VPSYSTVTGTNQSSPAMATGTSLFRKLVSVWSGFTITGVDLGVYYGGEATTASMGLATGSPELPSELAIALSYGPSTFTPPALATNVDASSILKYWYADDGGFNLVVPASTTWQWAPTFHWRFRLRYQFRLTAASDFCFQVANNAATTQTFAFQATARVYYA